MVAMAGMVCFSCLHISRTFIYFNVTCSFSFLMFLFCCSLITVQSHLLHNVFSSAPLTRKEEWHLTMIIMMYLL